MRPEYALALNWARKRSKPATVTVRSVVTSCQP
jgi:hypothetical protein